MLTELLGKEHYTLYPQILWDYVLPEIEKEIESGFYNYSFYIGKYIAL